MHLNSGWMWAGRVAKVLALLFFFLPWLVVSCNGQNLIEASGYQLATGTIELPDVALAPEGQNGAWWAIGAMVVIVLGLIGSFVIAKIKMAGRVVAATSAVALVLLAGGMAQTVGKMQSEMSEQVDKSGKGDSDMDKLERQFAQMMGQAIQVDIQSGYWLTLLALAGGIAGGVMAQWPRRGVVQSDNAAGV
ncbi:hypothetical protein OB03_12890 [Brevundimonas sp. GN22]